MVLHDTVNIFTINMKTVIVLFFAIALGATKPISDEVKEALEKIHGECSASTGVEKEDIIKAMEEETSDDPKIGEHVLCFQEKLGVMDKDGKIQNDVLKEKLSSYLEDEEKAEAIVTKCAKEEDSALQTAIALAKCIHVEKIKK